MQFASLLLTLSCKHAHAAMLFRVEHRWFQLVEFDIDATNEGTRALAELDAVRLICITGFRLSEYSLPESLLLNAA
jgi:hypothetical protein